MSDWLMLWCSRCGRRISARIPENGDGTARIPAKHKFEGKPCDGSYYEAVWADPTNTPTVDPDLVLGSRRRRKTETSSFGVSGRQSHDASRYYARALEHAEISADTTINRNPEIDRLWCHTSEVMSELADNSVALMVTSPSYHVGKQYDLDISFVDFLAMLYRVFAETYRVIEPGGRAVINVANLGRKPYVHFSDLVVQMCKEIGFLPRGEIIWIKGEGAAGNVAWGSWRSPANPVLRDLHEYLLCFSKARFDRALTRRERDAAGLPSEPTITKEDFMESTLSVWKVRPEFAKRVGHPAPFPVEIPRRFIELFTYKGDLVLDPFMGSGTTAVAATMTGRHYVGYDLDSDYIAKAHERIAAAVPPPALPDQEAS